MKLTALVGALSLAACSAVDIPLFDGTIQEPQETPRAITDIDKNTPLRDNFILSLPDFDLKAATPDPFSAVSKPICDVAALFVGQNLALPVTCEGEGLITIASSTSDPEKALALFAMAVRSSGGTFNVSPKGVAVVGKGGTGSSYEETPSNPAPRGSQGADSVGYMVPDLPIKLQSKLAEATLQRKDYALSILTGISRTDALELVSILGIDVQLAASENTVFAVGKKSDLLLLESSNYHLGDITLSLKQTRFLDGDIEALEKSYPDVKFSYQPTNKILRVTGSPFDIAGPANDLNTTSFKGGSVKLEATFIAVSTDIADILLASINDLNGRSGLSFAYGGTFQFGAALDKMVIDAGAKIVSKPSLVVTSGSTAKFSSGENIPVATDVNEEGQQSLEFMQTGVEFTVTPDILPAGNVSVEVELSVSSPRPTDGTNPSIDQNTVSTTVEMKKDQVLAIGGLDAVSDRKHKSMQLWVIPSKNSRFTKSRVIVALHLVEIY